MRNQHRESLPELAMNTKSIAFVLLIILSLPSLAMAQGNRCLYYSVSRESLWQVDHCGDISDSNRFTLAPELMDDIYFNGSDLACVIYSKDNAFWVHRRGRSANVNAPDLACMDFEEGLSIANRDGRQVYIDNDLHVVLDPGYESIGHFVQGYAVVCNGPFNYEQVGEHTFRTGGKCGLINRAGELLIEVKHASENYEVFQDYRNAHNECPPPPIEDRESALCHAKRHARNLKHSDLWINYSLEDLNDRWLIVFKEAERSDHEYTLIIGKHKSNMQQFFRSDLRRSEN